MEMTYLKRNQREKLEQFLQIFPVVLIIGARQVGKTTLARQCRPKWQYFDLERESDFEFITRDFDFFFKEHPQQIIIDEAQESAQLFKEIRGVIDSNRSQKNRFILTGSSSPELLSTTAETLAGRVGIIQMGTLKYNERLQQPLPPFYALLSTPITNDRLPDFAALPCSETNPENSETDFLNHMLCGGYPETVTANDTQQLHYWMDSYHQTYLDRDIRKLFPRLDMVKFRRFTRMVASLSGTIVNKAQLGRSIDVSEVTIRDYLEIAAQTFIWRNLPSYESNRVRSTVKMPKGIFRDSGLLNHLLNITNREQLLHSPLVGQNFESTVIEEILKGLEASPLTNWSAYYYRTRNGAEIDLILEGPFGTLPIEIKFGSSTRMKQLTSLNRFIKEHQLPLGIVINNSDEIRQLNERILQIPVTCI